MRRVVQSIVAGWVSTWALGFWSGCETQAAEDPCIELDTEPCDVSLTECQQRTFCLVLAVRGGTLATPPPVKFISEDEYILHLMSQSGTSTPQTQHWDAVLELLGVLAPDEELSMAELKARLKHIIAYYSRADEAVVFVDRGIETDPQEQVLTLAHEYVHALRDAETDLVAFWDAHVTTKDQDFAARTLVEGEAVFFTELLKTQLLYGMELKDVRWDDLYGPMLTRNLNDVAEDSSPFVLAGVALPYPLGGAAVTEVYLESGPEGVEELYLEPRMSSIDWMEPLGNTAAVERPSSPTGPEGLVRTFDDVLGAAMAYAFFVSSGMEANEAFDLARHLRHDAITTFWDEPGDRHAAAWSLAFESEAAASDALNALESSRSEETIFVARRSSILTVQVMSDASLAGSW